MAVTNTILTDVGRQKRTNAIISGINIKIAKFVIGDGNGDTYTPTGAETALINEKYRTYIGSMGTDKNNKATLQITSVIPEDIGGFVIREYGLIDEDGDLIAIGTCDPINKPDPSEGKIYSLAMVIYMTVLNAMAFEFSINYNGYVTYQYLFDEYIAQTHNIADQAITSEKLAPNLALPDTTTARTQPLGQDSAAVATMKAIIQAINNLPDSTTVKRGLIQLATNAEALAGADGNKGVTPYSLAAVINSLKTFIAQTYATNSNVDTRATFDWVNQNFATTSWVNSQDSAIRTWALSAFSTFTVGQSWASVSMSNNATYYNTTGKPIMLNIYVNGGGGLELRLYVNGLQVAIGNAATSGLGVALSAIIPINASYSFSSTINPGTVSCMLFR